MKIKKFFIMVAETLSIDFTNKEESKKRALKKLIIKLEEDKEKLEKILLKKGIDLERKIELEEELEIYTIHIIKGKKILEKKLRNK